MSTSAREVRKTVTILFCDLVHSTGLAEGDPEAYRRVLDAIAATTTFDFGPRATGETESEEDR